MHGNGPQVGDELVRNEIARAKRAAAARRARRGDRGWIGYMIQQSLENALRRAGSDARGGDGDHAGAASTRTIPRSRQPTKFIGHAISGSARAGLLEREGIVVKQDGADDGGAWSAARAPLAMHEIGVDHGGSCERARS